MLYTQLWVVYNARAIIIYDALCKMSARVKSVTVRPPFSERAARDFEFFIFSHTLSICRSHTLS